MTTERRQTEGPAARRRSRDHHDDAPDTSAQFEELARLRDGARKEALRQQVVEAWIPMAERLARQFRDRGESLDDLEQVAALGLVKAVRRYDPDRGAAFESYAVPTVIGEIKRHFRDNTWGLHVPRRVQELRSRVRAAEHELSHSLDGRGVGIREIADHTGMNEQDVRAGMGALNSYAPLSLDVSPPARTTSALSPTRWAKRNPATASSSTAKPSGRCSGTCRSASGGSCTCASSAT